MKVPVFVANLMSIGYCYETDRSIYIKIFKLTLVESHLRLCWILYSMYFPLLGVGIIMFYAEILFIFINIKKMSNAFRLYTECGLYTYTQWI